MAVRMTALAVMSRSIATRQTCSYNGAGIRIVMCAVSSVILTVVPFRSSSIDGSRLGSWVSTQRSTKDALSADRRQRLEAVDDWTWVARASPFCPPSAHRMTAFGVSRCLRPRHPSAQA